MSDEVGEMAEKTSEKTSTRNSATEQSDQGTTLRERRTDEPPNPRKRMWEENTVTQEAQRPRDEL